MVSIDELEVATEIVSDAVEREILLLASRIRLLFVDDSETAAKEVTNGGGRRVSSTADRWAVSLQSSSYKHQPDCKLRHRATP